MRRLLLALLLFSSTQSLAKSAEIEAQIVCYYYNPRHPYLDTSNPELFLSEKTFFHRGRIEGSFFVASKSYTYSTCAANCNVAIPRGHTLLRMTAIVGEREYTLAFADQTRMVVFGDSLSDEGRVVRSLQKFRGKGLGKVLRGAMRLFGCGLPRHFLGFGLKPYWNGMFSNGPMWPSYLSMLVGTIAVDNDSFGGSTTGKRPCHHIHFLSTLKRFLNANKDNPNFSQNTFLIWLGANNYFQLGKSKNVVSEEEVEKSIQEIAQGVQLLCDRGARNIVLFTVPNPLKSPKWVFDEPNSKKVNHAENQKPRWQKAVSLHNAVLRKYYSSMSSQPSCKVSLFDVDKLLQNNQYRLSLDPLGSRVDMDAFGYFDPVHPTTMVHCFLASELIKHLAERGAVNASRDYAQDCKGIVAGLSKPTSINVEREDL